MAIWPPTAEIKYWRNLNLPICDCEAKYMYHYVILACGFAIHMIRPSRNSHVFWLDRVSSHGSASTGEFCSRPSCI